jgi:hypothetical protein
MVQYVEIAKFVTSAKIVINAQTGNCPKVEEMIVKNN